MLKKIIFIKTNNEFRFIKQELDNECGTTTSCVSDDDVPPLVKTTTGKPSLHPLLINEAQLLGKSYDVKLAEPLQYWAFDPAEPEDAEVFENSEIMDL